MNQFLKVPPSSVKSFLLGLIVGLLVVVVLPGVGEANYAFQIGRVRGIESVLFGIPKNIGLTLILFSSNFSIALLVSLLPLILFYHTIIYRRRRPFESGDFQQKLRKEIYFTSTLYSVAVLFFYGLFVFGLFLGYIYTVNNSHYGLFRWILYLIPHGILEILGIIMAASTGIVIRDNRVQKNEQLPNKFWNTELFKDYVTFLFFLAGMFILSAFIEVYFSNEFVKYFMN